MKYNLVQYIYHGFDKDKLTIDTLSDGYIEFENVEQTRIGWYDNNGNIKTISNSYIIIDIKNDKVILQKKNDYENYDENTKIKCDFIIIDITGKFLRHTTAINIYDNMYLLKNENNKMILVSKELNTISNEYDKIITNVGIDIRPENSSYY